MQALRGTQEIDKQAMVDKHGRLMRKLRISLLDACNLRCQYCMPAKPQFMPAKDWASVEELTRITANLLDMGIEQVRLTGGEPLLRSDFAKIVQALAPLPIKSFGLTTNGLLLEPLLPMLKENSCTALNISLDSLTPQGFAAITRRNGFETVMSAIYKARNMGFKLKVNAVIMRGLNDHEVLDFAKWSGNEGIEVRFLEVMNIGVMKQRFEAQFVSADEMQAALETTYALTPLKDSVDSTSYNYTLDNGARLGFIASQSKPFCTGCSRLRLSPKGHIRPCLFREDGIDLKPLARQDYGHALRSVIALKPMGRIAHVAQPMYQIGG